MSFFYGRHEKASGNNQVNILSWLSEQTFSAGKGDRLYTPGVLNLWTLPPGTNIVVRTNYMAQNIYK